METQPESKKYIFIGTSIVVMGTALTASLKSGAGVAIIGMGAIILIVGMKKRKGEDNS